MMIREVYERNIYIVVLNNVINEMRNGKTLDEAINSLQKTDKMNYTSNYLNKENSMFYDNGKL
jgi:hypothetical protein